MKNETKKRAGRIRAVAFCRVSSEGQELGFQREAVLSAARERYAPGEIAVVEGKESAVSLAEERRETIAELKRILAENPDCESVWFYAVDRLARRVRVVVDVTDDLRARGVNCVFLTPARLETLNPDGTKNAATAMVLLLAAQAAETEAAQFKNRVSNARKMLRKSGRVATGSLMFGYRKSADKKPEVCEPEAEIVRRIFREYSSGNETRLSIARRLASDPSVAAVTDRFSRPCLPTSFTKRIGAILSEKSYSGRSETVYDYPAVVSPEIQDRCLKILAEKRSYPKTERRDNVYVARGLLRDPRTGHLLGPQKSTDSYKTRDVPALYVSRRAADALAIFLVRTFKPLLDRAASDEDVRKWRERIEALDGALEEAERRKEALSERLSKVRRWLLTGRLDEASFDSEKKKIDSERKSLELEEAELRSERGALESAIESRGAERKDFALDFARRTNSLLKADRATLKKFAREVIEEIEVRKLSHREKILDVKLNPRLGQGVKTFMIRTDGHVLSVWKKRGGGWLDVTGMLRDGWFERTEGLPAE